jgi:succinate dehydrogenase hydrophobic anchor subunit
MSTATMARAAGERSTTRRIVAYLVIRVTGAALAVLVLGHLLVTHVVTDVAGTDASFVARHWGSALWLAWDSLLLAAAVVHGTAGLWLAIEEYAGDERRRCRLHRVLLCLSAVLVCIGFYGIAHAIYD